MKLNNIQQKELTPETEIKSFKCADEDLNCFLFEDAKLFQEQLLTVTYLLESFEDNDTVAYYSLLADKISYNIEDKSSWNKLNRRLPNAKRRRSYPAIKLGRLAINEKYTGNGLGTLLLDGIKLLFCKNSRIGARFLTVDALTSATDFYLKNGFQFFTESDKEDETRLMFFDLKNFMD